MTIISIIQAHLKTRTQRAFAFFGVVLLLGVIQWLWPEGPEFPLNNEKYSTTGERMSSQELKFRGKKLRAALHDRVAELDRLHQLPYPNSGDSKDISDTVEKYIPLGMSFQDTAVILRSAGFELADMPPRPARADFPEYDRFTIAGGLSTFQLFVLGAELRVTIEPSNPEHPELSTAKKIKGDLSTQSL